MGPFDGITDFLASAKDAATRYVVKKIEQAFFSVMTSFIDGAKGYAKDQINSHEVYGNVKPGLTVGAQAVLKTPAVSILANPLSVKVVEASGDWGGKSGMKKSGIDYIGKDGNSTLTTEFGVETPIIGGSVKGEKTYHAKGQPDPAKISGGFSVGNEPLMGDSRIEGSTEEGGSLSVSRTFGVGFILVPSVKVEIGIMKVGKEDE